jgi:hypothetical protein
MKHCEIRLAGRDVCPCSGLDAVKLIADHLLHRSDDAESLSIAARIAGSLRWYLDMGSGENEASSQVEYRETS